MTKFDLDNILLKIGGWGKFQKRYYFYLCCIVIFSVFPMSYIFVARDIKYRCKIDSCSVNDTNKYNPDWLINAVPFKNNVPNRCLRYTAETNTSTCTNFNKNQTETCNEFVFERQETTIVHDFNITCDENLWRLTIVGTISVIGELFCHPLAGLISDRFGRKSMMVVSVLLSTLCGFIRSYSPTYVIYVLFEFLDSALGSGMYGAAFILAMELVSTENRNKGSTILCCCFALGQVLLGAVAYITPSWRILLRVIYIPGIAFVSFFWLVPESIRWLLSKGRRHEAEEILNSMVVTNGNKLSTNEIKTFLNSYTSEDNAKQQSESNGSLLEVFKSKTLLIRLIICCFTWICCNFPYYGLTIHSVALSKDLYRNFIFTALIEIPAYLVTYVLLDRLGRRKTLCSALILSGIACILVNLAEDFNVILGICLFLSGKFFMTIAYTALYIYTTEMFPTKSRHTTFAVCSMFGRFGSMLAPQVPLLVRISKSLPLIIFGVMAITSGVLAVFFPETVNTRLPENIQEAKNIKYNIKKELQKNGN